MDVKIILAAVLITVTLYCSGTDAKPISLVERCWCRSTVNTVSQRNIRELKFVHTPNCPFQVIAKLKNNKEVCINSEMKWLQQYLKNALEKMKKAKQQLN
ncbi:chemokine (C-X-C motif) ligand 12a (stromal cell-derived factor 1) [Trichomycterus rosablanca]|uniref:chemokine (C-X-C motif) ligand 12a (stromal cell-derived factor 1) n=1 Tax=Trichomycterus rosablanca TaxID=2290929 RepID=UPI002F3558E4